MFHQYIIHCNTAIALESAHKSLCSIINAAQADLNPLILEKAQIWFLEDIPQNSKEEEGSMVVLFEKIPFFGGQNGALISAKAQIFQNGTID